MLLLRARRAQSIRPCRPQPIGARKLFVEPLEDRTLLSGYTFTRLTDAATDPFAIPNYSAINDSGAIDFGATLKDSSITGIYLATGGTIRTIAQNGSGFSGVGNSGMASINASGTAVFVGTSGGVRGLYLGDGTTTSLLLAESDDLTFHNFARPVINDSGDVAFWAIKQIQTNPRVAVPGIFLYTGGAVRTLTLGSSTYTPEDIFDLNNNGQIAFYAYDSADLTSYGVFVTDGTTRTTIAHSGDVVAPINPGIVSRPTINDSGTVAFVGVTAAQKGVFTGNGGPLTTIYLDTTGTRTPQYPQINNDGDVAYLLNTGLHGMFLYDGGSHLTSMLIRRSDTLDGKSFVGAPYGISLNNQGQIGFTAQRTTSNPTTNYFEIYRADPILPTLSIGDAAVTEGDSGTTNANFAVTLSAASTKTVTVRYATTDGTATTGGDYTAASGTLTFLPGETSKTITVAITGDRTYEPDEAFSITLSNPSRATILTGTGTGTINNDDPLPSISLDSVSAAEGNSGTTSLLFTLSLSNPSYQAISVSYATADGTATTGDGDYAAASGAVSFAPGETSKTITIVVNGDSTSEPDETFSVALTDPSHAHILAGAGTGTILNDDPLPSISLDSVAAAEGNSGTTAFVFTVSLSNPSSQAITVDFATGGGTATAGTDYVSTSGTLTIPAGNLSGSFTVLVNGDTTDEFDETFDVVLSNPIGGTVTAGTGTGTIRNDDASPSLSISGVSQVEGDSGTTTFVFQLSLSEASGKTVSVDYATADSSATAGSDYQAASGRVTFAPGETTATIGVLVNGDTVVEPDETFLVTLSGAVHATPTAGQAAATILNDDVPSAVSLTIDDVTQDEGNRGTTPFVFTVRLSAPSAATVTVNYATADGTALATGRNHDYTTVSGTLTFDPGQTAQTISVLVNGDTLNEFDETFFVNLSGPVNASIDRMSGIGTIRNDDAQPEMTINDVAQFEGNSGTTAFVFTVSLSAASSAPVTAKYVTANNTARSHGKNADFTKVRGTVTFSPGETSQTISVLVNGDTLVEPDETFFVTLSAASGATIRDDLGVGTILNDDGGGGAGLRPGLYSATSRDLVPAMTGASGSPMSPNAASPSTRPVAVARSVTIETTPPRTASTVRGAERPARRRTDARAESLRSPDGVVAPTIPGANGKGHPPARPW